MLTARFKRPMWPNIFSYFWPQIKIERVWRISRWEDISSTARLGNTYPYLQIPLETLVKISVAEIISPMEENSFENLSFLFSNPTDELET